MKRGSMSIAGGTFESRTGHWRGGIHIHAECLPKARKELLRTEARYHINTRVLEGSYEYVGICK